MNITSLERVLLLFKIEIRFSLKLAFYFENGETKYTHSAEISFLLVLRSIYAIQHGPARNYNVRYRSVTDVVVNVLI